ncbi:MAG: TetR family transcriptional regulator, partial [Alphaproteobacteria bacterium]
MAAQAQLVLFTDAGTRGRLLRAALAQFAQYGFEGASVREITAAAGANLAAVNYHFGSKEALYHAVVSDIFNSIRSERLRLLEACAALPEDDPKLLERIL